MTTASYRSANEIKTSFNDVYGRPTPHAYFAEMHRLGYVIGQEARPYFHDTVALMREQSGWEAPVRMLDLGCSYGVGSALVKYGLSFGEIADFFATGADLGFRKCVDATRRWLAGNDPVNPIGCIGADCSEAAIKFAAEAGLIDDGIARDLEADQKLDERERAMIRRCNLLTSTGAIGYVGANTLAPILSNLGKACPPANGPYSVVTIMRLYASEPIKTVFNRFGYRFEPVPGVRLRQRRFHDETERNESIRLLSWRGINPDGWESAGHLYADLFVAAPPADFPALLDKMEGTRRRLSTISSNRTPGRRAQTGL